MAFALTSFVLLISDADLQALKSLGLGFQNIGPTVANLERFIEVETIILSGNLISELNASSFATNTNLQFLSLSRNRLTEVKYLNHLEGLQALDLGHNNIEEIADLNELPPNLLSLKLVGNPIEQRAVESGQLSKYRKPFVLHLQLLEQLDKIEIVPAERMSYLGTINRRINIDQMLRDKVRNDEIRRQGFKLQNELRIEIKREQGKSNVEIVSESLDEFAKQNEMDSWLDNMADMMQRQELRNEEDKLEHQLRQRKID